MSNPWEEINLHDYESHMSLDSVYQLQVLNSMMKEQFYTYDIASIMVLGIAGGNGLEHIDKEKIKLVYGVDVNQKYLNECKKRYQELEDILYTICVDLLDEALSLPESELLIANLLLEYVGYECFKRVVKRVKPQYISCIIQINSDESFVSDSPYLHAFDCLEKVHHQMEENTLIISMQEIGYKLEMAQECELPNGKKFVRVDFSKIN